MLDTEIDALYESGSRQVLQRIGKDKLPEFVEALKRPEFLVVSPLYEERYSCGVEARSDWKIRHKSQLIESFLLNIPIQHITLWEVGYDSYELLDGLRRITAIRDFYADRLTLQGLELLPTLNGCTYGTMPQQRKRALDRHSINTIAVIADSDSPEALKIKRLTFDRLHPNN